MNLSEARTALRKVLAYCPAQSVDEFTPEAWAEALDTVRLPDALEAIRRIGRREMEPGQSRYIEPGHIRAEVRRLRAERIEKHPNLDPPSGLSVAELIAWQLETRTRIADGEVFAASQLEARPVDYAGVVKGIDD